MIDIRTEDQMILMKESGRITAEVLSLLLKNIRPGITGLDLDLLAEKEIKRRGGEAAFKKVKDYSWTICITVNEQVVHGIPTESKLQEKDLVSIDIGTIYKGWYTDAAWTIICGQGLSGSKKDKFLKVGEEALWMGIEQAVEGNKIGDISHAIQSKVEGGGYSVVRALVGHGVGKALHEDPEIPGYGSAGVGLKLYENMTFAVEVIYNQGKPDVLLEKDNWTIVSADGSLAGLFEMTVAVGKEKVEILTDIRNLRPIELTGRI